MTLGGVPNVLELSTVADRSRCGGVVKVDLMGLWRVADRSLLGVLLLLRACFTRDGRWIGLLLGDPNRRGGNKLSGVPYRSVLSGYSRLTRSSTAADRGDSNLTFTDTGDALDTGDSNLIGGTK